MTKRFFLFKICALAIFSIGMLNRFDDASNDVARLAIQCVAKIELDPSDAECMNMTTSLIGTIISRLILYLDDPCLELQPILIGSIMQYRTFNIQFFLYRNLLGGIINRT